jgi:hypothetical protein
MPRLEHSRFWGLALWHEMGLETEKSPSAIWQPHVRLGSKSDLEASFGSVGFAPASGQSSTQSDTIASLEPFPFRLNRNGALDS